MRDFYGRKISRRIDSDRVTKLRDFEFFLDESTINSKIKLVKEKFNEFNLEIGFGTGCNLINAAEKSKECCFFGCDPFVNGSIKLFKVIKEKGLTNIYFSNLDFYNFARFLKKIKIKNFYILFPDPWPKQKHKKRRLINKRFVERLVSICEEESSVYILTDDTDYLSQISFCFENEKTFKLINNEIDFLKNESSPIYSTKYYNRAVIKKMKIFSLLFNYKN